MIKKLIKKSIPSQDKIKIIELEETILQLKQENFKLKNKLQKTNNLDLNNQSEYNNTITNKISLKLADHGFNTMWLKNDWQGIDLIAKHIDGAKDLKIQFKKKLFFDKNYIDQNIYICYMNRTDIYLYPHDLVLKQIKTIISSTSWIELGQWSSLTISKENKELLESYKL